MRKAPCNDYAGNDIHEGDRIQHPDGTAGTVVFFDFEPDPSDKWRVVYDDGDRSKEWSARIGRLCLQIGDKGQAVVTPNAKVRGDAPLYGAASLSTDGLEGRERT